jgi:hypothetical protein
MVCGTSTLSLWVGWEKTPWSHPVKKVYNQTVYGLTDMIQLNSSEDREDKECLKKFKEKVLMIIIMGGIN